MPRGAWRLLDFALRAPSPPHKPVISYGALIVALFTRMRTLTVQVTESWIIVLVTNHKHYIYIYILYVQKEGNLVHNPTAYNYEWMYADWIRGILGSLLQAQEQMG